MNANVEATRNPPARGIQGWHVLVAIVGFFAAIIGVNLVMAYLAITTYSGVDTPDAYRKGLAYNERIESQSRQTALGWRETVSWQREPGSTAAIISVSVRDAAGGPVQALSVTADFGRPATTRFDRAVPLREASPGLYEARLMDVAPGTWVVDIAARRNHSSAAADFEARKRIWLKP